MADAGQFQPAIDAAAAKYGIDPAWLTKLLYRENKFQPQGTSSAGAQGFAQFMPGTAKQYGVDVNDPASSIEGAAHYLSDNLKMFGGNQGLATAAYNWGPGHVQDWMKKGGSPPVETQDYVASITGKPIGDWRGAGGTASRLAVATPPGTTLTSVPPAVAGGPVAPAPPGAPAPDQGNWMTKLASALKPQDKAAGGAGGEDQPPDFRLNPVAPAQAAGGRMMMGAGGQNTFGRNAAEQGLAQQGFMTQPSLVAFNAYKPPSPIGAPSPGGATPGSAQGVPTMPGTTLNSPGQLQMAMATGQMDPNQAYSDLYNQLFGGQRGGYGMGST